MTAKPLYTTKQMGDAAEMMVAANLTLCGVPSFTGPVNWPGYDVIAAPRNKPSQRVSVKCRGTSNINFRPADFDWLAIVVINERPYRFFILPRDVAVKHSTETGEGLRTLYLKSVPAKFAAYEDNFELHRHR